MTISQYAKDGAAVLCVEGDLAIYRASDLKKSLLNALMENDTLEVNLSAVTEIDTAGVQILIMLKQIAERKNKGLRLVAHSEAVSDVFDLLNLAPYFGDPVVIARSNTSDFGRFQSNT
ncbi:MAG: STAS domain-containing protein [Burkholderiaceae bacterium]